MPARRNKTSFRNAQLRDLKKNEKNVVKQTQKRVKKPAAPSGGDTSEDETLQNLISKRTEVPRETLDSTLLKSTPMLSYITSTLTVSSIPNAPEKDNDIITYTAPDNNVTGTPKLSLSPSIIVQEIDVKTSYDQHSSNCDLNKIDIYNTIEDVAQIHTNSIDGLDAASEKQTLVTTYLQKSNGAIFCEPDSIDILDSISQPKSLYTKPLSDMSTSKLLSLPVILAEEIVVKDSKIPLDKELFINKETPTTLILASSASSRDVVLRSSGDLENNIIVEEVDLDTMNIDQSLDTSTPLGSPSTSTIIRFDTENLSFSNINTPTSSMCANSSVNDETYAPSHCGSDTTEEIDAEIIQTKRKRKVKKKTDLGRIRKVKRDEWIDSQRKKLKNQGLSYVSRGGKERPAKSLLPGCDDKCRLKCKDKIVENVRKLLFKRFWSLGDRVRQWELISRWCERTGKKRITTEGPSKRKFSVRYYLPKVLSNDKEERVIVCKKMFLQTFAIGEGVVRTALNKTADCDGLLVESDMRGHHDNHPKVKNDEMVKSVCEHVKSFTPVEAHYTRKESSKLYLDSDLTMSKMFKLYEEWVTGSDLNRAKTLRQYTDIVNENFNIEFHRPKKDQCDECTAHKNMPKPINQDDQDRYDDHTRNKDLARSLKNEDKLSALRSPSSTVTAAFDFQKVHSAPHAESSILYYKRKLNVFNFTIFEMGQKVGKCYMWHEGTAKRSANEVASCVYDFIRDQASKGIRNINLYSDNCGGQNRNRIVFMMYLVAAKEFDVNITHRFF